MMTIVKRDMEAGRKKRKSPRTGRDFRPRCLKCGERIAGTAKQCPACGHVIGSALLTRQAF